MKLQQIAQENKFIFKMFMLLMLDWPTLQIQAGWVKTETEVWHK